jgi:hypothetical protein
MRKLEKSVGGEFALVQREVVKRKSVTRDDASIPSLYTDGHSKKQYLLLVFFPPSRIQINIIVHMSQDYTRLVLSCVTSDSLPWLICGEIVDKAYF